jgi:hypothetical protein
MAVKLDPTSIDAAEGRLEFLLGAPGIVGGGVDKARAEAARIATLDAYRGAMAEARIAEHEKAWPEAERRNRSLMAGLSGPHRRSRRAVDDSPER